MKTFVFYADQEHLRQSNAVNTVVAVGADEEAARASAQRLFGTGHNLAKFKGVELTEDTPPFAIEGGWPISFSTQNVFSKLTRNGNTMRAQPGAS